MKNLSAAMSTHIEEEVTSLCSCWRIVRKDGVEICLTDHDRDLIVDGKSYLASDSYDRGALKNSAGSDTDETEITGFINSTWLSEVDLAAGLYDFAELFYFLVNWQNPNMGTIKLRRGWIGEVRWQGAHFSAELRGLSDALRHSIGRLYTPSCAVDLGSNRCQVALEPMAQAVSIAAVLSATLVEVSGFVDAGLPMVGGLLRFTSGANSGQAFEVTAFTALSRQVQLFVAPGHSIEIGDLALIYPGCDKRFVTCRDVYSNSLNFQGFPHIPGVDGLLEPGVG